MGLCTAKLYNSTSFSESRETGRGGEGYKTEGVSCPTLTRDSKELDGFQTLTVSYFVNGDKGRDSNIINFSENPFFLTSDNCADLSENSIW